MSPVDAGTGRDTRQPRYLTIERAIEAAVSSGDIPQGAILIEGPVADIFGTSRTPVRTAFGGLEERGLLRRFEGRGFVVGDASAAPRRVELTHDVFGLTDDAANSPRAIASGRIARGVEAALTAALPFGQWRINEKAMAGHYDVSRTVVRELLPRFEDRGLVRKGRHSHWLVGPLTAQDIAHYFDVRGRLEPLALIGSAPHFRSSEIDAMWQRVRDAVARGGDIDADELEVLETELHITLLSRSRNDHLLRMIAQSQAALVVNRLFAATVGAKPFEMSLREHLIVLEFGTRGTWEAAARALEEHLKLSAARTRQRLKAISVFPEPDDIPAWLVRQRP